MNQPILIGNLTPDAIAKIAFDAAFMGAQAAIAEMGARPTASPSEKPVYYSIEQVKQVLTERGYKCNADNTIRALHSEKVLGRASFKELSAMLDSGEAVTASKLKGNCYYYCILR